MNLIKSISSNLNNEVNYLKLSNQIRSLTILNHQRTKSSELIKSKLEANKNAKCSKLNLTKSSKINSTDLRPLYLDYGATTPLDPRVLDAMLPFLTFRYGNPHSRTHYYGFESEEAVELAREQVANLINADAKEIIFTSGATESNNLALKGVANFYSERKSHIITTQTEHKCVLDSCRYLENKGFKVTYLPVQSNGLIDLNKLIEAINDQTVLVSIMMVI